MSQAIGSLGLQARELPHAADDQNLFGETSLVEGVNNALRQGVSYLGRKTLAFARSTYWLQMRLHWFLHHWNIKQKKIYD